MALCPTCGQAAAPRPENRAFPFCSPRCRTIDLGRWLDDRYRVPCAEDSDPASFGVSEGDPADPDLRPHPSHPGEKA